MRKPPAYRRLSVSFGELTFPANGTIAFESNFGESVKKAQNITVEAGRRGTWMIEFVPQIQLPKGAKLAFKKLENEYRFAWRHQDYWPDAMDYVTVEDENGKTLPFECETESKSKVPALVTLPRDFKAGEKIFLRMGDQRRGGLGSYVQPNSYDCVRIAAGVMLEGDEKFRISPEAIVSVKVIPCPAVKRYYFFAPSKVRPNQEFTAAILPVDISGNPTCGGENIRITTSEGTMPQSIKKTFMHTIHASARLESEGVSRLELNDSVPGISAHSNPIKVSSGSDYNIYWGEFHWHGYDAVELNVLNSNTSPDKAFQYGRDVTRLDFCGTGSHIFRSAPEAVHKWWEPYRGAAKKYDEEGRYVTFMGCEWRDREEEGGDRNIVWKQLDAAVPDPTWKIQEIYKRFRGEPVMVIPHVGGAIAMPCHHHGEVERLCEMTSGHGNFEWFVQEYLSKGFRVGLIGGSDGHKGTPGHPRIVAMSGGRFMRTLRRRDSGWKGGPLLAALAENLDRNSLWEAFHERRVYASTGARAIVDFKINGSMMGSEISADKNIKVEATVEGTAPIERVDLIRGQYRLKRWEPQSLGFSQSLVDRPPDGLSFYYLRIEEENGEMLWSSPIWIHSTCGGSNVGLARWNEPEKIDLKRVPDSPASQHLDDLLQYLRTEENAEAFSEITPFKIVKSPLGNYAVFLGYMRGHRMRIHWFYEFELPRVRLEAGWVEYGRQRIKGQPWARPLFEGQSEM